MHDLTYVFSIIIFYLFYYAYSSVRILLYIFLRRKIGRNIQTAIIPLGVNTIFLLFNGCIRGIVRM